MLDGIEMIEPGEYISVQTEGITHVKVQPNAGMEIYPKTCTPQTNNIPLGDTGLEPVASCV